MHTLPLSNGVAIPRVGLGVFRASAAETRASVQAALGLGYRHVDTAQVYGNETDVGAALRESGVPRDEVFVTTKLASDRHGYDATLRAFEESRRLLAVERVDLFLLHWPVPGLRLDSRRAAEKLYEDGLVRAIGVSNFLVRHLDELAASARHLPHVDQIEVHPFHQQRETRAWCAAHGVTVEAYSPLTKGRRLGHPAIVAAAARLGRSPAQVLLRWGVEQGMVVLPKSVRPERIAENAALFDFTLDEATRAELAALDEGLATGWDPRGQA